MKKCTGRNCLMQYDKVNPATCQAVAYCPQATPPKSNADKIRCITDEELAEWLVDHPVVSKYDENNPQHKAWLDWLKQRVEE